MHQTKVENAFITFDKPTYDLIMGILAYVDKEFDNPEIIDQTALMVRRNDLKMIIEKLEKAGEGSHFPLKILMSFNEWAPFNGILIYVTYHLQLPTEQAETLEALTNYYSELDDQGRVPTGP